MSPLSTPSAPAALGPYSQGVAAAGLGLEHVAKTTVFLSDLADFAAVNEVYARAFVAPFPARSCVQAAALPRGARLEVEAIAVRPS